jgi:hypothetical protein
MSDQEVRGNIISLILEVPSLVAFLGYISAFLHAELGKV